jgi:hypothetical protein
MHEHDFPNFLMDSRGSFSNNKQRGHEYEKNVRKNVAIQKKWGHSKEKGPLGEKNKGHSRNTGPKFWVPMRCSRSVNYGDFETIWTFFSAEFPVICRGDLGRGVRYTEHLN